MLARMKLHCTDIGRVSSREQRRSGRGADGLRVVLIQYHPAVRQSVNIWRLDLVRAVEAEVVPSLEERRQALRLWQNAEGFVGSTGQGQNVWEEQINVIFISSYAQCAQRIAQHFRPPLALSSRSGLRYLLKSNN
jgi:hypothetical protein